MALIDRIISAFTKTHSALPDRPSMTATDLKAWYDQSANELKTQTNGIITDLTATTDGSSGADQIGAPPVVAGDTSSATVMAKIRWAYAQFLTVVQGSIAAGSILLSHLSAEVLAYFAKYKNGSGTFSSGGTTCVVTDAFITENTQVIVSPDPAVELAGSWKVESAAGSFTITSSATETQNINFDWGATK